MKKSVLITGATGFIGGHLINRLRKIGASCFEFKGDLSSFANVYSQIINEDHDVIIHLGGIGNVDECERNPDKAFFVNLTGTLNIIESLRRSGKTTHFIFSSTGQVYSQVGISGAVVVDEAWATDPSNIYALSKLMAEDVVKRYFSGHEIGTALILRLFNHTHKTQQGNFFFPQIYSQILAARDAESDCNIRVGNLAIYRDFSLVDDLIDLLERSFALRPINKVETGNVCSGQPRLLSDLVNELALAMKVRVNLEIDQNRLRNGDPKLIVGSNAKLEKVFGWKYPSLSNQEFVRRFLEDFQD